MCHDYAKNAIGFTGLPRSSSDRPSGRGLEPTPPQDTSLTRSSPSLPLNMEPPAGVPPTVSVSTGAG